MLRDSDIRTLEAIGQFEANRNRDDVRGLYMELRGVIGATKLPHVDDLAKGLNAAFDDAAIEALMANADVEVRAFIDRAKPQAMAQSATLVTWAAVVLGLAVLSKLRYNRTDGWVLEPGFPGLAEVLSKLQFPSS